MESKTPTMLDSYWVHDLSPFLIRFPDSWIEVIKIEGVRYYGVAYLLGFLVAGVLLRIYYQKGKSPLNSDQQSSFMTVIIVGVLVGGRMGYMFFYNFDALLENPLNLFKVWEGGMASHGGMIGVAIAVIWMANKEKVSLWTLGDIAVTLAPAGIFFGRIANFINGELYGRVTDVKWAVIFPSSPVQYVQELGVLSQLPRHPSQIYAALLEGLFLFAFMQYRFWKKSGHQVAAGVIVGEFLIAYGLVRIFDELFREPDSSLIIGLSKGQFYSILMVVIGIVIMIVRKKQKPMGLCNN